MARCAESASINSRRYPKRGLLARARRAGGEKARGAEAAQIRHDDPASGNAKCGQHVIVVSRIVRPAVHEEDGIAGRIAALLVGDVEACGADVLDGGAHDAMVWPARPSGMGSSGKWCRMRLH